MSLFYSQRRQLQVTPHVLQSWLAGCPRHEAVWRPREDAWSILDVVNHLADEERNDFPRRLSIILAETDDEYPPIDPVGSVESAAMRDRSLEEAVEDFDRERTSSLEWLDEIAGEADGRIDFDIQKVHPQFGAMKAGDMFAAWIAHDLLHLRQIARIQLQHLGSVSKPYSLEYAGDLPAFD